MIQWNFITQEVRPNSISEVKVDASFRNIAKNTCCFHIWKIEEDRLEAVPKTQFGTFYDDCAYILYASCAAGTYIKHDSFTREAKNPAGLERFIHFWLGERVSPQKKANASHKVMELDTYFGNIATEYRESQDNESVRFLSYFQNGITILSGSLTQSKDLSRLYQLRERKWLRCIEMETISWDHFCSDYIMILSTETHLFLWIGRSSSLCERRQSLDVAQKLQEFRELVIIDDGYEQSMPESRKILWNTYLPLHQRMVNQFPRANDKPACQSFRLYTCGYKGSRYWFEQVKSTIPSQSDFQNSKAVYMLDGFSLGVWLWVGSQTTHVENVEAMRNGRGFVKKKKYPSSTCLVRVVEGHEPVEFIQFFPTWQDRLSGNSIKAKSFIKFDSLTLSRRPKLAADSQLIDDGCGERFIFRITDDQVIEMAPSKCTTFVSENCYVVVYAVAFASNSPNDKENVGIRNIVYRWYGLEANRDAIHKCDRLAKDQFGKLKDKSMMVHINEGEETPHFLQIFSGKLIILLRDRNTNNNSNSDSSKHLSGNFTLKIIGDASYNSKAIEIDPLISMSSKECFVLKSNTVWVWCGQSSTGDAREISKSIGSILGEFTLVMEGKEPKDFWKHNFNHISKSDLNQNEISNPSIISNIKNRQKLHLIYMNRGNFFSHEILGFSQSDLTSENNYILDAGQIIFVWLGAQSPSSDLDSFVKLGHQYLENYPSPRTISTAIAVVRQNDEPNVFKGFFDEWDHKLWIEYQTYEVKRKSLAIPNEHVNGNAKVNGMSSFDHDNDFDKYQKYPLSLLQQEAELLPTDTNPLRREVHLTHDDFVALFNISFWEFETLPNWKQQELKKKHKLF